MRAASKRVGRFRMSLERLRGGGDLDSYEARELMALFGSVIVIRAQDCWASDAIDYLAMSPLFEELKEGESAPWYHIEYQRFGGGLQVNATRSTAPPWQGTWI